MSKDLKHADKQFADWARENVPFDRTPASEVKVASETAEMLSTENGQLRAYVKSLERELESLRADKERLDWLGTHQTINYGLSVGGYFYKSDLRWQGDRIRQAIDEAKGKG